MQRLEVSGAVRPIYGSLGVKRLKQDFTELILEPDESSPHFTKGFSPKFDFINLDASVDLPPKLRMS